MITGFDRDIVRSNIEQDGGCSKAMLNYQRVNGIMIMMIRWATYCIQVYSQWG